MDRLKTTLILGAGASRNYNFPLGESLLQQILAYDPVQGSIALGQPANTVRSFVETLRNSAAMSIDTFLARRPEFSDVGKRAIAHRIMAYEDIDVLRHAAQNGTQDHWYRLLIHALYQQTWDELDISWLTVVTFNYDRSLEMFLLDTMEANYAVTEAQAFEKLAQLPIHHVYGSFGPLVGDSRMPYDKSNVGDPRVVAIAAQRLQVIPDGRDNDEHLLPVRAAIANSERIAFLGFAFDAQNLRRLGFPNSQLPASRLFGGTCLGMTDAEQYLALNRLAPDLVRVGSFEWAPGNCTQFLRQHVFLET